MRQLVHPPRRTWRALAAVVAGAALFASGAFVAQALDDGGSDGSGPPTGVDSIKTSPPLQGGGSAGVNTAVGLERGQGAGAAGADAAMTMPAGGCQVPLPGALSDGKIDPSAAGMDAKFLGSAFQLTGFSIRAETDCYSADPTGAISVVMDTQWKHADSGLAVSISQRQQSNATASVLEETSARFWEDGYAFWVGVNGYSVQPLAGGPNGAEPAIDKGFAPGPDPRSGEVLRAALADLSAPAEACFYVAQKGTLDDLASIGIGDPRGAIPAGFVLQDAYVQTWSTPDSGCNTPSEGLQTSFNATWNYTGSDRQFGALFVGAYAVQPGETELPGNSGEYGANWSNGKYHFNVGAKMDPPIEAGVVEAIARALDPQFDNACMARERTLTEREIAALGINTPSVPDGYSVARSYVATTELTGDCTSEAKANYSAYPRAEWNLRGPDGAVIDVRASKAPDLPPEARKGGFINEHGLWWWTDAGVQYEVSGYIEGGNGIPSQETLIAIAKSLDPGLDVDTLQAGGGGAVPPVAPPAKDLPATAASTR